MNDSLKVQVENKNSGILSFEDNEYTFSYKTEDNMNFISLTVKCKGKIHQ